MTVIQLPDKKRANTKKSLKVRQLKIPSTAGNVTANSTVKMGYVVYVEVMCYTWWDILALQFGRMDALAK